MLQHGGAVSGFVSSSNTVWPDAKAAVVVFANMDGSSAPGAITRQIAPLLMAEAADPHAAEQLEQARRIFSSLQAGTIDRSLFNSDCSAYFTDQVLSRRGIQPRPIGYAPDLPADLDRIARRDDLPSFSNWLQRQIAAPEHLHHHRRQVGPVSDSIARAQLHQHFAIHFSFHRAAVEPSRRAVSS